MAENTRRKYTDLRYKFIRGLISYERFQRKRHWMKQAAEWTSKSVVSLDLTFTLIKSVRQASELEGIGGVIATKLREISKDKRYPTANPGQGKFVSSAPALLVALHLITEELGQNDVLNGPRVLVSETQLKQVATVLSEETFADDVDDKDVGFCQAWWRLNVLANRGLVKKRSRDKLPVYELLPPGETLAKQLIVQVGLQNTSLTQLMTGEIADTGPLPRPQALPAQVQDHLYTNDDGSDGLVLYVDIREWGGDRLGLITLCRRLGESGVRYATRHLATGDYSWIWTCGGRKIELPVLVERKRADDLAESMADGRYNRQRENMLLWRQKYTEVQVESTLMYIVEGDPFAYVVQCADGCGGVGRCGNPTFAEVQAVITDLEADVDFNLVQTPNNQNTIDVLAAMTQELQVRINTGDFLQLLGHAENLEKAENNNAVNSTPSKPVDVPKKQRITGKATKNAKNKTAIASDDLYGVPWNGKAEPDELEFVPVKKRKKKIHSDNLHVGFPLQLYTDGKHNISSDHRLPHLNSTGSDNSDSDDDHWTEELVKRDSFKSFSPQSTEGSSRPHTSVSSNPVEATKLVNQTHLYTDRTYNEEHVNLKNDHFKLPLNLPGKSSTVNDNSDSDDDHWTEELVKRDPFNSFPPHSIEDHSKSSTPISSCPPLIENKPSNRLPAMGMSFPQEHQEDLAKVKSEVSEEDSKFNPPVKKVKRRVHDIDLNWLDSNDAPPIDSVRENDTSSRHRWHSEPSTSTATGWSHAKVEVKQEPGLIEKVCDKNMELIHYPSQFIKQEVTATGTQPLLDSVKLENEHVKIERWTVELETIRNVLPGIDEDLARTQLDIHSGNIESAVSALLDDQL